MELIPFLIFAVIAFNIFKGFTKAAPSKDGNAAQIPNDLMRRLQMQMDASNDARKTPTQRGQESLARKTQSSPWGENGSFSAGGQTASKYLQTRLNTKTKSDRVASHKNPEQHGRRGKNVDQNRNRTDEWGERGDKGILSGKPLLFLLVLGGIGLYVLSNLPAG
ncbi:hypothetical protein [Hellea balneolensis]|uniref:hypothetical protein n=1 Tax=Hellea balneolensis TaxID=287478 RepID=UPI00040EE598|nr:hypothetical protein [Hellea balneolensis]